MNNNKSAIMAMPSITEVSRTRLAREFAMYFQREVMPRLQSTDDRESTAVLAQEIYRALETWEKHLGSLTEHFEKIAIDALNTKATSYVLTTEQPSASPLMVPGEREGE